MRIQLLGTGAAEGWPAVFCGCETCNRARNAGGKNIRTRQSAQIDDVIKIDLPPDTHYHQFRFGIRLSELKHLFITHSHSDHFAVAELNYLGPPFAHNQSNIPIRVYGNQTVIKAIDSIKTREELPLETTILRPFNPVQADHLIFTPIPARHRPGEQCFTYVAQSNTSTVLFAWDTGMYDEQSMERLSDYRFNVMIIECTQGTLNMPSRLHMGFDGVLELRDALAQSGACNSNTRIILTHFSHNTGLLHDELAEIAKREDIEVAWDGMIIDT